MSTDLYEISSTDTIKHGSGHHGCLRLTSSWASPFPSIKGGDVGRLVVLFCFSPRPLAADFDTPLKYYHIIFPLIMGSAGSHRSSFLLRTLNQNIRSVMRYKKTSNYHSLHPSISSYLDSTPDVFFSETAGEQGQRFRCRRCPYPWQPDHVQTWFLDCSVQERHSGK